MICTKDILDLILREVCEKIRVVYGDNVEKVMLFGSYARGDYNNESDIDIMILVNCDAEKIAKHRKEVISLMSRLCLEYDIYVSIMVEPVNYFNEWKDNRLLYKNIIKDGVVVYV